MITIWRLETDENDKPGVPENLKVTFTGPSSLIPFLNTADIQEDVMDLHDGTAYHFLYHRASLPVWSVYIVKYVRTSSSWRTADLVPDDIAAAVFARSHYLNVEENDFANGQLISLGRAVSCFLMDEGEETFDVIVQRSIKKDGVLDDFESMNLRRPKSRYFTKSGDILMKMPYPYDVVCVDRENLIVSDRIAIIRLTKHHNPSFIAHLLTNAHVKKQLYQLGSTERIPHTSLKEIKELELVLPDRKTQDKSAELLDAINEKIANDMELVKYDQNLKEGILNEIWEGGIDD